MEALEYSVARPSKKFICSTPFNILSNQVKGFFFMEQHTANKLIRPLSKYSGSDHREVVLLNQR